MVPQFTQGPREGVSALDVKLNSSGAAATVAGRSLVPTNCGSYCEKSSRVESTTGEFGLGLGWSEGCLMSAVAMGLNCCNLDKGELCMFMAGESRIATGIMIICTEIPSATARLRAGCVFRVL